jgi:hypothetical protein
MRFCGSLSYTMVREIDDVGTIGLFANSTRVVRFVLVQSDHCDTLKMRNTSAKLFPTEHVKKIIL